MAVKPPSHRSDLRLSKFEPPTLAARNRCARQVRDSSTGRGRCVLNRLMSREGAMATDIRQWTTVRRKSRRPAELRPVDEHANLVTHGLGLVLSLVASGLL